MSLLFWNRELVSDPFTYYKNGREFISISGLSKQISVLVIPETIKGKRVISLCRDAFKNKEIVKVKLNSNLNSIEDGAFANNYIENITIPSQTAGIGRHSFKNNPLKTITFLGHNTIISFGAFGIDAEVKEDILIIGRKGSEAEKYAFDYGYKFEVITVKEEVKVDVSSLMKEIGIIEKMKKLIGIPTTTSIEETVIVDITNIILIFESIPGSSKNSDTISANLAIMERIMKLYKKNPKYFISILIKYQPTFQIIRISLEEVLNKNIFEESKIENEISELLTHVIEDMNKIENLLEQNETLEREIDIQLVTSALKQESAVLKKLNILNQDKP